MNQTSLYLNGLVRIGPRLERVGVKCEFSSIEYFSGLQERVNANSSALLLEVLSHHGIIFIYFLEKGELVQATLMAIFFWLPPPVESGSGISSSIKWFQPPLNRNCGDRTMVLLTKFSTNHH
jgi:hypothetical protein